jgi:hypothetical protein
MLLGDMSGLLSAVNLNGTNRAEHTCMHDARLVQEVETEVSLLQGPLQQDFIEPFVRKQVSKFRKAHTQWVEDQTLMRPVRTRCLEIIQYQMQWLLSRAFGINGFEILGDGHFIVHLGGILPGDADLQA